MRKFIGIQAAPAETSGTAWWKALPSYAVYGSAERNIPPEALKLMAERANAVKTVVDEGASRRDGLALQRGREDAAKADVLIPSAAQ